MPVYATFTVMDGYLLVESSGEMATFEDGVAYIQSQVDAAREEGMLRLLVDDRKMTVSLDYSDILSLAEYWQGKGLQSLGLRVAALAPPSAPQGQLAYETTAGNRSIVFKVFFDRREALDWLLKPKS